MPTKLAHTVALSGATEATILLNAKGRVQQANAAARRFLLGWGGIRLVGDTLTAARRAEGRVLRRLIALAATGTDGFFPMCGTDSAEPVRVTLLALPGGQMLLRLRAPMHRAGPPEIFMRRSFGLTAREAELAVRFVEGATLDEAAERMEIGAHTARALQLRVFSRTGTASPEEFRRLVDTIML
jgi:DNA-binding CsgD family transcriptional regulator